MSIPPLAPELVRFLDENHLSSPPVIGLLILAHAPFASALLQCALHVYGSDPGHCGRCEAFDVHPGVDPAESLRCARELCTRLDTGDGVLVLTDLYGGTPANIAQQLAHPGRVEVLSGASLPMLLRALGYRSQVPVAELVGKVSAAASSGVVKMSAKVPQNQQRPDLDDDHASTRMPHHQ